jgi:cell division protein FtsI/penicillin-binding protein 2
MKGTWWGTRWLGFDAEWNKSIMVMLGSKQDPNVPNSTLICPYWIDLGTRLRYQFGNRDGSSFMALRLGYHIHEFPVLTYPQYISKSTARGFYVGGQNRLSFNQYFGLDMGLDLLILSKLLDKSTISNSQSGIGFRFNADFVATIIDRTGLTTLVSFGYGQTTYISNLVGDGVSGDSRSLVNANHFEQSYSDLHITFTARI